MARLLMHSERIAVGWGVAAGRIVEAPISTVMTTSTPGASGPALRSGKATLALSYPDFRILWVTTGLVAGGVWFQQVTLGWLAYDLTRSPLHVAGVVGVRTLPLLLAPITGVIADRFDRRKLLLIDQALVTILVFGFAALLLLNLQQVWHLYVFALLFGLLWAGNNPVRQVLVANTVPREALMNATALISLSFNLMRTLGPAVGGLVIAYMGPGINFLIQGVFFLFAGLLVIKMRTPYSAPDKMHAREDSPLRNLMDGFRHVRSDPTTLLTIGMSLGMSFTMLSIVFSQMPVYAAEVLGNDDGTYLGLLLTGMGIGGLFGTTAMAFSSRRRKKGLWSTGAFVLCAITIIALSQTSVLWVAIGILMLQQMCMQVVMTTNMTIIHTVTPDDLRGRVMGVYQMEIGMMPFGGFIAGAIATGYGVDQALLISGIVGLVLIALASVLLPRYRRLEI